MEVLYIIGYIVIGMLVAKAGLVINKLANNGKEPGYFDRLVPIDKDNLLFVVIFWPIFLGLGALFLFWLIPLISTIFVCERLNDLLYKILG